VEPKWASGVPGLVHGSLRAHEAVASRGLLDSKVDS
jgi:hypothetical protein